MRKQNLDHLAQGLDTNISSISPGILCNLKLTIYYVLVDYGFKCADVAHAEKNLISSFIKL